MDDRPVTDQCAECGDGTHGGVAIADLRAGEGHGGDQFPETVLVHSGHRGGNAVPACDLDDCAMMSHTPIVPERCDARASGRDP